MTTPRTVRTGSPSNRTARWPRNSRVESAPSIVLPGTLRQLVRRRRSRRRAHRANDELLHSPLELVEQAVLARAKHSALDVSSDDGARRMQSFIGEEIEQRNLDHRRGLRPFDPSDPEVVSERAYRNLTGYGPLAPIAHR